jgi:hypothetical protein
LSVIDAREALAFGDRNNVGQIRTLTYYGGWGGISICNAASAIILASALALILSKAVVSIVQNSEISGESRARAVLIELLCSNVHGRIGARTLRSGLVS